MLANLGALADHAAGLLRPGAAQVAQTPGVSVMLRHLLALADQGVSRPVAGPRSRFVLIGPPIAQLLVFGYAATFDLDRVPVAIYNEDPGALRRELVARLDGSPNFEIVAHIDRDAADRAADRQPGRADWCCTWVRASARPSTRGGSAPVQAILDGRNSNTALHRPGLSAHHPAGLQPHLGRGAGPAAAAGLSLETRAWYNENLAIALVHRARHRRPADPGGDPDRHRALGGPGTRAGHLRPAAGHPAAAGGDPHRQGHTGTGHRHSGGERSSSPWRSTGSTSPCAAASVRCTWALFLFLLSAVGHRADDLSPSPSPSSRRCWGPSCSWSRR